jgi:hypothetical protein
VVVLALAWLRLAGTSSILYQGGLFVCSLAAVAVIAAATHPTKGPIARALRVRPLVLLGMISYGVYLYHWPIFIWLANGTALRGWRLFGAQLTLTLAVAIVSFIAVERPIRNGVLRWPRSLVVVPATATVVVVSLLVVTEAYVPASATVQRADSLHAVAGSVSTSRPQARLLMVGNSVPYFLAREGFEALKTDPPLLVLNDGYPTCAFPPDATAYRMNQSDGNNYLPQPLPCTQGWSTDVATFRPTAVVFTMGDLLGQLLDAKTGQWLQPCNAAFDQWFESSLLSAVPVLTGGGAHLFIATSAYSQYYGAPVDRWPQTDCMNRVEHEVAAKDPTLVTVIDLGHYVCPKLGVCRQTIDGAPMRPDGIHYRGPSARAIAAWMLPQLRMGPSGQPLAAVSSTGAAGNRQ